MHRRITSEKQTGTSLVKKNHAGRVINLKVTNKEVTVLLMYLRGQAARDFVCLAQHRNEPPIAEVN